MKKVNPKNSYWITFYFTFTLEKMTKDKKKKKTVLQCTFRSDFSTHAPVCINIFQGVNKILISCKKYIENISIFFPTEILSVHTICPSCLHIHFFV